MNLTKTDFLRYLSCPEDAWLYKNDRSRYPEKERSLYQDKLIKEGYEVEQYAQQLFPGGTNLGDSSTPEQTTRTIENGETTLFQPSFRTDEGVFSRVDVMVKQEDGAWHLYEVKSSTRVKTDSQHNQVKDACFQKLAVEQCGYVVSGVTIIHMNGEYVRQGEINPTELLVLSDVSDEVQEIQVRTSQEIHEAINWLSNSSNPSNGCSCTNKTRSNHCDAFEVFNPGVPEHSIYEIGNIRSNRIEELLTEEVTELRAIPDNFPLSDRQRQQVDSARNKVPIIDKPGIRQWIDQLEYPLHFIDYETYSSAVPVIDGLCPHQHLPFQVSIHTLHEDGKLEHFEYLMDELGKPAQMLQQMESFTGTGGSFISWHAGFEKGRNSDMISWVPDSKDYLVNMNNRMFDLEDVFMEYYMDYRFQGRTSIKNVLPVLVPELSYQELMVQNGTMAMEQWQRSLSSTREDSIMLRRELLEYCKLDTFAMVRIFKTLEDLF